MVLYELTEERVILVINKVIETDARTDKYFFDFRQSRDLSEKLYVFLMVDFEIFGLLYALFVVVQSLSHV